MPKRSQRHLSGHDRAQTGCMRGLIGMFDFRQGRATRRLLSDRKEVSDQAYGTGPSTNKNVLLSQTEKGETELDCYEHKMSMDGSARTSVKELMEVEMFNEQFSTNQPNNSEISLERNSSKHENHTKRKRRSRSLIKSMEMDVSELNAAECKHENQNQVLEQNSSEDLDLEKLMEVLVQISERNIDGSKCDFRGDVDVPSSQAVRVKEKLAAAIKLVIKERLSNSKHLGEEGNTFYSKDFMDALETLSLNKGMFLKLNPIPDSVLVNKDQRAKEKLVSAKSDESSSHKYRNFFRRRSKSMDSYPLVRDEESEPPKIVILKPGLAGAEITETDVAISNSTLQSQNNSNKAQNDRTISQFSFTEIKRKIKHAMGKERRGISPDRLVLKLPPKNYKASNSNKGAAGESFGWSSPNRNHFYTERFAVSSPSFRKAESVGGLKDEGSVINGICQNSQVDGSIVDNEAKKHLSEILKSDGSAESMTGKLPKSLGRILSLPEYNGSPCYSPRNCGTDIFVTAQMRLLSPGKNDTSGLLQDSENNHRSPRRKNVESQFISSDISQGKLQSLDVNANALMRDGLKFPLEVETFTEEAVVPEAAEIKETRELKPHEPDQIIIITSESSSSSLHEDSLEGVSGETDNKEISLLNESSSCFKSDLFGEDFFSPTASSPHSPVSREVIGYASDKMERPSPVSILEPLFTDDDVSPARTVAQPVEKEIEPRHIHFEEQSSTSVQGICTRISLEDVESEFEYVEAVLLGSGLMWDEFLLRWLSSYEILDSSLFEEVELFSSRPRYDQKLLFDCANESLKEVCESYFGCFTRVSQGKLNTLPIPKGMDLIIEIWKRVEGYLLQHLQPHSMDQLLKMDLVKSGKWMNLHPDIELIGFGIGEIIIYELVHDFVTSLVDEFAVVQAVVE